MRELINFYNIFFCLNRKEKILIKQHIKGLF